MTELSLLIAGADEAGRGALAGPVYAAAVILPRRHGLRGLDDSKKLSPGAREALAPKIRRKALAWAVALATLEEIERLNILQAALLAVRRAVEQLAPAPARVRMDGNVAPPLACPVETVVGGDGRIASIMAASILAKVERDAEMRRLHQQFPEYGFGDNKGYGTPGHLAALRRLGPCAAHRRLFGPVTQMTLELPMPDDGHRLPAPAPAVAPDPTPA